MAYSFLTFAFVVLAWGSYPDLKPYSHDLPQHHISFRVHESGLRTVLTQLLGYTDRKFVLSPAIKNSPRLTIDMDRVRWLDLFKMLVEKNRLHYEVDRYGTIKISPKNKKK